MDELAAACARVEAAGVADTVDGVPARWVAYPVDTGEVSALMRAAARHDLATVARGSGTKLDWGYPPRRLDLLVDLGAMAGVVAYTPGDQVISVRAGLTLDALRQVTAAARQMLALDPVPPGGTVGGVLATNASGPLRMRYGTCRDLLIGITVVLADGTVARSGGTVVKNVAGYDLGKLHTGGYGTLGVITEATFRLHPLPASREYVACAFASPAQACAAAARVRTSQADARALQVYRQAGGASPWWVGALLEEAVASRVAEVAGLLGTDATVAGEPPPWWAMAPWPAGGTGIKVSVRLTALPRVLDVLAGGVALGGSIGSGVLYLGLPADAPPDEVRALVDRLRCAVPPADGHVVVVCSPVRDDLDRWGPVSGLDLMRQLKARFDPAARLAPGRFVGGI